MTPCMRCLLDTNAWIWLFSEPERINLQVRTLLLREPCVALSPMSVIEVAQKADKGRLVFKWPIEEWVQSALPRDEVELLPITAEIALRAYQWPADFHGDPADRIIAATAVIHGLVLVTSDEKLLARVDLRALSTR